MISPMSTGGICWKGVGTLGFNRGEKDMSMRRTHVQRIPEFVTEKRPRKYLDSPQHRRTLRVSPMTRFRVQWAECLGPTSAPFHSAHLYVAKRRAVRSG